MRVPAASGSGALQRPSATFAPGVPREEEVQFRGKAEVGEALGRVQRLRVVGNRRAWDYFRGHMEKASPHLLRAPQTRSGLEPSQI